jgi:hypothetical protein
LLTSRILHDEFSRGFRGRLRVLNGFRSSNELTHALRNRIQGYTAGLKNHYPDAVVLAYSANISIEQFIRKHSLLPVLRAVTQKDPEVAHGDSSRLDIIQQYGLRTWLGNIARYCSECIKEDANLLGFPYWHQSHQFPGIYWCMKHQMQLAICSAGEKAFDEIPFVE